jgi:hypothetical protein
VVLAPEGRVLELIPSAPLAGTEKAKCIAALLLTSPLPAFSGSPRRLEISLAIP